MAILATRALIAAPDNQEVIKGSSGWQLDLVGARCHRPRPPPLLRWWIVSLEL